MGEVSPEPGELCKAIRVPLHKNVTIKGWLGLQGDSRGAVNKLARVLRHQIVKKGRRILWGGFRRVVARARKGIDVIPCKRPRFKSLLVGGQILPQAVEFLVRPVPTELLQRCGHWLKPVKRARDYARA